MYSGSAAFCAVLTNSVAFLAKSVSLFRRRPVQREVEQITRNETDPPSHPFQRQLFYLLA